MKKIIVIITMENENGTEKSISRSAWLSVPDNIDTDSVEKSISELSIGLQRMVSNELDCALIIASIEKK